MMETTDGDEAAAVVAVRLGNGGLLLYETGTDTAWIESDVAMVFP